MSESENYVCIAYLGLSCIKSKKKFSKKLYFYRKRTILRRIHSLSVEAFEGTVKLLKGMPHPFPHQLLPLNPSLTQLILVLNPSFSSTHLLRMPFFPSTHPSPQPIFSASHSSPQPILLLNLIFPSIHPSPQPILVLNPSIS